MTPPPPPPPPPPPHLVVIPWPGQGHINPFMHFSHQLAARGFLVTFVNTHHNHRLLLHSHAPTQSPQVTSPLVRLVAIDDGLPADHPRDVTALCVALSNKETQLAFEEVIQTIVVSESSRVICIVADMLIPFGPEVARKFGIPCVAFCTQSAANYASRLPLVDNPNPVDLSELAKLIPGAPPLKVSDLSSFLHVNDPNDFMFKFVTDPWRRIPEAACVLINTFDELEDFTLQAIREKSELISTIRRKHDFIYTVGPLLPPAFLEESITSLPSSSSALWPEDYACLEWLSEQAPSSVLYVSFGSIAILSARQFEEFILGLEASQQPILLVARDNLTAGHAAVLPQSFSDRTRGRCCVVSWAPQLHVLSHPSVGGFLTHCGWNSTLEAVSRGVPMLTWPHFADQMLNCRFIVDKWKIGLEFEGDEGDGMVCRVEVEKKVRALMQGGEGRELRERAWKLREAATRAVMGGGSSHQNLELFCSDALNRQRVC